MITARYLEAVRFAGETHDDHLRKSTRIPYLSHLMSVSALVMEGGGDEDQWIAALLHDAVEDRGGTTMEAEIRARFGDRVANIVMGCSDGSDESTRDASDWTSRKRRYIAHVADAGPDVWLVSCADKLHNARCILADYRTHGMALWDRFNGTPEQTIWYYRSLVEAFTNAEPSPPHTAELARTVEMLAALMDG